MSIVIEILTPDEINGSTERTFSELPIRIGRDPACDVTLPFPFVSRKHARIEAQGGDIVIVDEGSTNGIRHAGTRIPPHSAMRLDHEVREFSIDDISFAIRVVSDTTPSLVTASDGDDSTSPLEATGVDAEVRTSLYSEQNIEPSSLDGAQRILEDYRVARRGALRALHVAIEVVDERERSTLVRELVASFGDLAHDPELSALAREHGVEPSVLKRAPDMPVSAPPASSVLALEALAVRHVPEVASFDDADAAAFLDRVDTVLRVAIDGLAELETYSHEAPAENVLPSPSPGAQLRARLLDWTSASCDAKAVIGELVAGVSERYERMTATAHLEAIRIVESLSPEATSRAIALRWWSPFPRRALWNGYVARYSAIVAEPMRALWRLHCRRSARIVPPFVDDLEPPFEPATVDESGVIPRARLLAEERACA
jgi:hypothetical protein